MRKLVFALCCISVLGIGCKENNPPLDFGTAALSDTTYVLPASSIPSAEARQVLVEEFTGTKCSNCPAAHLLLENIAHANPNRINLVALHLFGVAQAVPPAGSTHDFRDSAANNINSTVYNGGNALPSGGVNRVRVGTDILLYSPAWADAINTELARVDSVNLSVESTYDAVANSAKIIVKVTYVQPVFTKQNLSVIVVEDSMTDIQEFPTSVDDEYEFTNVFRDMITSVPLGDPLGDTLTVKEAGRVFQRIYAYTPKAMTPAMVPSHLRVIAFVNNNGVGGDYRIIQSKQCKLVGP